MVAEKPAAQPAGPSRPPANIEDFLWNVHSVLVAAPDTLALDALKEAYSKHHGHKCAIERFLVIGEGGLGATLKRIPHVVTLFQDNSVTFVKATQPANTTKQQLIDADAAYRKELLKKNVAAKAKAATGAKAPSSGIPRPVAGATNASPANAATAGADAPATKAGAAAEAQSEGQGKRPADAAVAAGGDGKRARAESDAETLAKMLVQGVVRVLQNRQKQGKGPLPIGELEDEFKALWKVPFNLQQAGEKDAVSFLQKWPNKVELADVGGMQVVQLSQKGQEKPKAAVAKADASPKALSSPAGGVPLATAVKAATAAKTPTPAVAAKPGMTAVAAKAPTATAGASSPTGPSLAKPVDAKTSNAPQGGATRPPGSIEDFLWNLHSVIESHGGPLPVDQLREQYSKILGHKCAIERFLVVGEGGLAATLRRIPHVVTVVKEKDEIFVRATLPSGTTKDQLTAADHQYRRQLQQKAKAAAQTLPANVTASAAPAAQAVPVALKAPPAAAPPTDQVRPAAEAPAGEPPNKKLRGEDVDTLSKMLVQGVVRVLQNRHKEGKGPLPVSQLEDEFKALWKVPFNLRQAGETDAITFLQKWPNKVEVVVEGGQMVVQLSKKVAEKAKAPAKAVDGTQTNGVPHPAEASPTAASPPNGMEVGVPAAIISAVDAAVSEAASMLEQMQGMAKRQEALLESLGHAACRLLARPVAPGA